jgi:hypothetical protein
MYNSRTHRTSIQIAGSLESRVAKWVSEHFNYTTRKEYNIDTILYFDLHDIIEDLNEACEAHMRVQILSEDLEQYQMTDYEPKI